MRQFVARPRPSASVRRRTIRPSVHRRTIRPQFPLPRKQTLAGANDRGQQSRWSGLLTKRQFAYQVERGRTGLRMEKAALLILSSASVGNPIKNIWCCGVHVKGRAFPQAGDSGDSGAWPAPRPAGQEHDVEAGFRQPRQLQRRRGVLWRIWW